MPKFQQIAQNIDLVSRLLARLDTIEATATDLQTQITANTADIAANTAAIAAIDVSGINTTLGSLQTQIDTINSRLAAAGIP